MKKLILAGAALMAATGCGGVAGEPLTTASMATVVGELKSAMQKMPTSNTVPALPVAGVTLSSNVSTMATDCETSSPASPANADSDSIADYKVSTFDCVDKISGTVVHTRKGSVTITDLNTSKADVEGGYRVDFAITHFNSKDLSDGRVYEAAYSGYWQTKADGDTLVSTSDFTGLNKYENNFGKNNYTYNYIWEWRLTPSNVAQYWVDGSLSVSGSFSLSGDFIAEVDGAHTQKSGSFVVKYYTKDLKYSNACSGNFYKSGSFFIDDSYGTLIEMRFDCANPVKYYVNGKESTLFGP